MSTTLSPEIATLAQQARALLGDRLLEREALLAQYAQGEGHHAQPAPALVARPKDKEEVQQLVRMAARCHMAITAWGAGTSVEGNAACQPDGLCIDFSAMDQIIAVNAEDQFCVVQPGVTRTQLNRHLRDTGLFFPVDPGADASLGGMVATRASGTTTLKYGGMRDNVLALELVMADGETIRTGTAARKSSAGYDLTRLFTGSEGTLGLIVEASLRLHPLPETVLAMSCDFPDVASAVQTVMQTMACGIAIARMELLDERVVQACNRHNGLSLPERPTLFLEFHGAPDEANRQSELVTELARENGAGELRHASHEEDRSALWHARHQALPAARAMISGARAWTTDICVPISQLAEAIGRARMDIDASGLFAPIVGHVGDGNFHVLFILPPGDDTAFEQASAINARMIEHALSVGGTCTGEHGIGIGKRHALLREHGDKAVAVMKAIKTALDPDNRLNPGKVFL